MDNIEELIESQVMKKQKNARDVLPAEIPFTPMAYRKAEMIGPIIKNLSGKDYEWSAFLLAKKNDPRYVVRDLLIQKDQNIKQFNLEIKGEDIAKTNAYLGETNKKERKNLYVIGWVHGHGDVNHLGPSIVDERNFSVVLNSVSLNTEQKINVPLPLIETRARKWREDDKIIYSGEALEDAMLEYVLGNDKKLEAILKKAGIKFEKGEAREKVASLLDSLLDGVQTNCYQSNIVGFAYFVIMSNKKIKPYSAIAYNTEKAITKVKSSRLLENVGIKKIVVKNDIFLTKKTLEREIKENIDIPRKGFWEIIFPGQDAAQHSQYPIQQPTGQPGAQGQFEYGKFNYGNEIVYGQPYYVTNSPFFIEEPLIKTLEEKIEACKKSGKDVSEIEAFVQMLKNIKESPGHHQVPYYQRKEAQMKVINGYFFDKFGLPAEEQKKENEEKGEKTEEAEKKPEEKKEEKEKRERELPQKEEKKGEKKKGNGDDKKNVGEEIPEGDAAEGAEGMWWD